MAKINKKFQKGFVISDLHLDTSRTDPEVEYKIEELALNADFCVLNGDIFDFKWSESPDMESAISFAIEWLEKLCETKPSCRFYYILGNHDCLAKFVKELDKLELDNFSYHRTHLFLDDKLFIHGDLPLNNSYPFHRPLEVEGNRQGGLLNNLYNAVIHLRIHKLVRFVMTPSYCVKKIMESLKRYHPGFLKQINHIYFGHTHHPFEGYLYEGVYFHNTGSAVKHLETRPLEVNYEKR